MPSAFNFIASATATSGAVSSLQFTSIPSTYDHLYLTYQIRSTRTAGGTDTIGIRINGVTATDYYVKYYGSSFTSYQGASTGGTSAWPIGFAPQATSTQSWEANTWGCGTTLIPLYKATGPKPMQADYWADNNTTYAETAFFGGTYTPTSAITQIDIISTSGNNIAQNSVAYLYGISGT
jgi:hypothetical protein